MRSEKDIQNEKQEIVNFLIESPYNNLYEEDEQWLMESSLEELYRWEAETFQQESDERSLYDDICD